jgi:phosphoribosylglycinamide formyltransferase 1
MPHRRRTAVLISGRGSNLRALLAAAQAADYPADIALVISNRPDAAGLALAREAGVTATAVDHKAYPSRAEFDAELDRALRRHDIELVACAGFMRILTHRFLDAWAGHIINIHPALLPLYKGLDTHGRALVDGVRVHGCTVHYVVPEIDAGPIIAQAAVPVLSGDTAGDPRLASARSRAPALSHGAGAGRRRPRPAGGRKGGDRRTNRSDGPGVFANAPRPFDTGLTALLRVRLTL